MGRPFQEGDISALDLKKEEPASDTQGNACFRQGHGKCKGTGTKTESMVEEDWSVVKWREYITPYFVSSIVLMVSSV